MSAPNGGGGPGAEVAGGDDVRMPGEAEVGRRRADACIEVIDVGCAGFAEDQAVREEAGLLQDVIEQRQRAGLVGRHALAADECLRELEERI